MNMTMLGSAETSSDKKEQNKKHEKCVVKGFPHFPLKEK